MIDIHSHILPLIDDGSETMENSIAMLNEAKNIGVTDIILTPHYRAPYLLTKEEIKQSFKSFLDRVKAEGIDINLYLGQEIFVRPDTIQKLNEGKLLTLNDSRFVLIEFDFSVYSSIVDVVRKFVKEGFVPIVAHPERYPYVDKNTLLEIKRQGGLNQINANFLSGRAKKFYYKKVKSYLKDNLVDFIASDIHSERLNALLDARKFVEKKFGLSVANKLFIDNAKNILEADKS